MRFGDMNREQQTQALLNLAAHLMFNGIPPTEVLREFSKIETWREMAVLLPSGRWDRAFLTDSPDWNPHNP